MDEQEYFPYGVLKRLDDLLPENYKILCDDDTIVITALERHGKHLDTHAIEPKNLDPSKLVCWVGAGLLDGLERDEGGKFQAGLIIDALIRILEEILLLETSKDVRLPARTCELLKRLVIEEYYGDQDHGVGMNGLYMSFHCAIESYRAFARKSE